MKFRDTFRVIVFVGLIPFAAFATPRSVTLEPMQHTPADIVFVRPDGSEISYTAAQLEEFPNYALHTTTPWREVPADFEGVLLKAVLEANGLADSAAILVTAENDFTTTIPREVWETLDIMIATRVNGVPHTRRARGPFQFVLEMSEYQSSDRAREEHLVWMVARIEAVN